MYCWISLMCTHLLFLNQKWTTVQCIWKITFIHLFKCMINVNNRNVIVCRIADAYLSLMSQVFFCNNFLYLSYLTPDLVSCHLRYYPALRTLEQLEESCLPQAGSYRFCGIMAENIPRLRTHIRDVSMSDLKDFLESIRKHSDKIGETAMKQVCVRLCVRERWL